MTDFKSKRFTPKTVEDKPKPKNVTVKPVAKNGGKKKNKKTNNDDPSIGGKFKTVNLSGQNMLATCNNIVAINVPMSNLAIADFCWAVVSYACSLGFMTYTANSSDPFFAYVELAIVATSAITNTVPATQQIWAPIGKILDYLRPQVVKVGNAEYVYTFTANYDPSVLQPTLGMGPSGGRTGNLYIPTSTMVNAVLPQLGVPSPFTSAAGVAAYNLLMLFLSTRGTETQLVEFVNHMKRSDASAFAFTTPHIGSSTSGTGAISMIAELETFLNTPRMCVWTTQTFNSINRVRCGVQSSPTSGTPSTLALEKLQNTLNSSFKNKKGTRFMPYDFYQFVEMFLTWMEKIANIAANDAQNVDLPASNFLINLTGQEMILLLRMIFMSMFADSAIATQTIYPSSSIGTPEPFIPLVASANTGPLGDVGKGFRMPQDFVEMLCAATEKRQLRNQGYEYVPVIGVYEGVEIDTSRFVVSRGEVVYPLFIVPEEAGFEPGVKPVRKEILKKGEVPVKLGETQVNFIDGNVGVNTYVQLNAPYAYSVYLEAYDVWLSPMLPFSSIMGTTTKDGGVHVLAVIGDFVLLKTMSQEEKKDFDKNHSLPDRMKKARLTSGVSPYDSFLILATAYNTTPLETVLALTNDWIRPSFIATLNNFADENVVLQKMQSWYRANFTAIGQDGLEQTTIAQRLGRLATRNTKARNTNATMADELFVQISAMGQGGIIGELIGKAAGFLPF
jgi:hypothetical protein